VDALSVVEAVPVAASDVPDVPAARAGEVELSVSAEGAAVWLDAADWSGVLWFGEVEVAVLVVVSAGDGLADAVPEVLPLTLPEGDAVWSVVLLVGGVEVWSRVPLVVVLAP